MAPVSLVYPKIGDCSAARYLEACIAFEKLDGTNLHWVWDREFSWTGFGTRRDRYGYDATGEAEFVLAHSELVDARNVFESSLAGVLSAKLSRSSAQDAIVFAEYFGPRSFAGSHDLTESKKLVPFDVSIDGVILGPQEFLNAFGDLGPRVVYQRVA